MEKLELSPLKNTQLNDPFWNKYTHLVTSQIIPYQWEALNDRVSDAEPSHCISNFKVAAGLKEGTFEGAVFQDTDVAKWLEAVAYSLSYQPDRELEETADEVIDLIGRRSSPTAISTLISPSLLLSTAGRICAKGTNCIRQDTFWRPLSLIIR